jgi:sulfate adenylyltransferase
MQENQNTLIEPYGGRLVNLLVPAQEREVLLARAAGLPRLQLTTRNVCALELLSVGGFSPLECFMGRDDYERVLEEMRTADGTLFPLPVTLHATRDAGLKLDSEVALADQHNNLLAVMRFEEIYEWDRRREARLSCGTEDGRYPLVAEMNSWGALYVSGRMCVLALPRYHDFRDLRLAPASRRSGAPMSSPSRPEALCTARTRN